MKDLPYVGALFRYRQHNVSRREIIVIMTPHIVRSEFDQARVLAEESAKMKWCVPEVIRTHGHGGEIIGPASQGARPVPVGAPQGQPTFVPGPAYFGTMNSSNQFDAGPAFQQPGTAPQGFMQPGGLQPGTAQPGTPQSFLPPGPVPGNVMPPNGGAAVLPMMPAQPMFPFPGQPGQPAPGQPATNLQLPGAGTLPPASLPAAPGAAAPQVWNNQPPVMPVGATQPASTSGYTPPAGGQIVTYATYPAQPKAGQPLPVMPAVPAAPAYAPQAATQPMPGVPVPAAAPPAPKFTMVAPPGEPVPTQPVQGKDAPPADKKPVTKTTDGKSWAQDTR